MFAPQFTTRRLLMLVAGCSVFFVIVAAAVRGQLWAACISLAVASLVLTFLLYAMTFQITFVIAKIFDGLSPVPAPKSPFAQHTPPPKPLVKTEGLE